MANKYGIQYVNFYTDGSAARKLTTVQRAPKATLPKPKKRKRKVIYLDPVATLGMIVAVCMLVMMFVGLSRLNDARQEAQIMEQYVDRLSQENSQLKQQYTDSYDLQEVERTALALGMVPQSQVPQNTIHVPAEQSEDTQQPVTLLEQFGTILSAFFA